MSKSPIRLRNRDTPSKRRSELYEDVIKSPIGKIGDSKEQAASRITRKSTRFQVNDREGRESTESKGTSKSNAENEEENVRENNENTPKKSGSSRLSRKRSGRGYSCKYVCFKEYLTWYFEETVSNHYDPFYS